MSEAYLLTSAAQAAQSSPQALEKVLRKAGLAARHVQEIHWLQDQPESLPWQAGQMDLNSNLAVFQWQATALLDHFTLQAAIRALLNEDRHVMVVGQTTQGQEAALLLASPTAVGRYNAVPTARLAACLSVNTREKGLLPAVQAALERHARALVRQATETVDGEEPEQGEDFPKIEEIKLLAGSAGAAGLAETFPQAEWVEGQPGGIYAQLDGLAAALESKQENWGLLISQGPHDSGLVTLVQRV